MNIWKDYFKYADVKSASDYLNEEQQSLKDATQGKLHFEITSFDSNENGGFIYRTRLSIRSKTLGNYGFEILTINEPIEGRWPVVIENSFTLERISSSEIDFLTNIENIISSPIIKKKIENLYHQSSYNK